MKKLVLMLALCLLPLVAVAGEARIESVEVGSHQAFTRVTLDLTGRVEHSIFTLKNPNRVVVDISDARLDAALPGGNGLVSDLRSGRHGRDVRLVLDLKAHGAPRSFFIPGGAGQPPRLVVDVYGRQKTAPDPVPVAMSAKAGGSRNIVIAVDAGHGGYDPGAHGPRGTLEKNVTLAISKKLAAMINAVPGMSAILTRKRDRYVGLRKRMAIAQAHDSDFFISIHANASPSARPHGGAVYALSLHGATSEAARVLAHRENTAGTLGGVSLSGKSKMLASVLLDLSQTATISASLKLGRQVLGQMGAIEPLVRDGVEQAAFVVLKSPDVPSILVETAFISNPRQEKLLAGRGFQRRMATAVLNGVVNYFQKHPPPGTLIAARHGKLGQRRYVINSGDTLSGIANRFDVSVRTLRAANGLSGSTIRIGDVLTIPAG